GRHEPREVVQSARNARSGTVRHVQRAQPQRRALHAFTELHDHAIVLHAAVERAPGSHPSARYAVEVVTRALAGLNSLATRRSTRARPGVTPTGRSFTTVS